MRSTAAHDRVGGAARPGGWLLLAAAALAGPAVYAAPPPVDGLFVTVRTLTSEEKDRIKANTQEAVARFQAAEKDRPADQRRQFRIVFDFNPDGHPSASTDFGACYELAKHLLSLRRDDVTTIAFAHGEVRHHSVLPALACEHLVMSGSAKLGDVTPTDDERGFYEKVIKGLPWQGRAVALRLLDKGLKLRQVQPLSGQGTFYVEADKVKQAKVLPSGVLVLNLEGAEVPVLEQEGGAADPLGAGVTQIGAKAAKELGLCALIAETRQDVAAAYQLPPASLREDPLLGRHPVAWRVDVRGQLTRAAVQSLQRRVRRAVGKGANLIFLRLDCGQGDFQAAVDFAEMLRNLKDDKGEYPVTTVAYVPGKAPDTALVVALGCSHIVMHKDAQFGDCQYLVGNDLGVKVGTLEGLARAQGYPEALARGFLDKEATLYAAVNRQSAHYDRRLITQDELDADRGRWQVELPEVKKGGPDGTLLVLGAEKARDLQLARYVVEGDPADLNALYGFYGVNAAQVQVARDDWLDAVAEFLRQTWVAVLLVMVGITCLILELKLPGVSLPGIVAAVCFVLFFWAHSQLAGQFTWLAVLLFVLGLVLIGLEIFVFPGFGVPGISGILLVLVSLALVTLERKPETTREWLSFGATVTTFGLGMVGAVIGALVLAWYLPHIPYLNRFVLKPQGEADEASGEEPAEAVRPELAALLGAIGVAATPLRPAGKVQFGEQFVDVVAEGSYVEPGTRVQVIEIEGNRVVVKEV